MFWLKCCPKCAGDLYEDRDLYGSQRACLQCGHYLTQEEMAYKPSYRRWVLAEWHHSVIGR